MGTLNFSQHNPVNVIIVFYFLAVFAPEDFKLSLASLLCQTSPLLSPQKSAAACCEAICRSLIQGKDQWIMGKTKIFLKVRKNLQLIKVVHYQLTQVRFSIRLMNEFGI